MKKKYLEYIISVTGFALSAVPVLVFIIILLNCTGIFAYFGNFQAIVEYERMAFVQSGAFYVLPICILYEINFIVKNFVANYVIDDVTVEKEELNEL
jgi:ABC-type dipeptide/oligopeptide/nickel transport system permease component